MKVYEVEITTTKFVDVKAETEEDAKMKFSETNYSINDFDWEFYAELKELEE